jgi:hypothetical protein
MEEGVEDRKIEKALVEYYGLKPPAKTVIISSRAWSAHRLHLYIILQELAMFEQSA